MTTTRRRRWLLAAVAVGVVAGVVAFVVLRGDPRDDSPRLAFLNYEYTNGQSVAVFRFGAPKRRMAILRQVLGVSTQNLSTGRERKAIFPMGFPVFVIVEAGRSTEFGIIRPPDEVWRLRCHVVVKDTSLKAVLGRVKVCWQTKSFAVFHSNPYLLERPVLESEPITNALPSAADSTRP
jgi:hypothetical protein